MDAEAGTKDINPGQVQKIASGFVLMKGAIDEETQIKLAKCAMAAGLDSRRGFWLDDGQGGSKFNATNTRGRIYDAISTYPNPEVMLDLCLELVNRARSLDDALPEMQPTHLLLLCYTGVKGMGWHSDTGKNDGDNNHPIVSISLGNSCNFGYRPAVDAERTSLVLESGDVAVWGGPLRMMEHSVKKVIPNTMPEGLKQMLQEANYSKGHAIEQLRFNFTFRDAPSVRGQEDRFAFFRPYDTKREQSEN